MSLVSLYIMLEIVVLKSTKNKVITTIMIMVIVIIMITIKMINTSHCTPLNTCPIRQHTP